MKGSAGMKDVWRVWALVTWAANVLGSEELGDVGLQLVGLPLGVLQFAPAGEAPVVVPVFDGVSGREAVAEALGIVTSWELTTMEAQEFFFDLVDVHDALTSRGL
ncbi:MAG: hypothetical protein Q4D96_03615 [Propionibacteriaceae bacterium]|nr:hypothetical protein [Propionibacteriaceae bacterium]